MGKTGGDIVGGGELGVELKETDREDDLDPGSDGESIPLLGGGEVGGGEGFATEGHAPGPVQVIGLGDVSDKRHHGDTAVLDLGMTEPSDGKLVGLSPESGVGELQGVPVLDDGVEILGQGLEIGLRGETQKRMNYITLESDSDRG